jgi:hypothetical protein
VTIEELDPYLKSKRKFKKLTLQRLGAAAGHAFYVEVVRLLGVMSFVN